MSPSMDTPSGQILATKNIKDFTPMSEISPSQNILAITDNTTGAGGKITTSNLCKSLLSSDAGNSVIQGEDGLLYGNAGLVKYRDDIVFQTNDWALGEVSGEVGIYISLQDNNVGFPLTNTDYWKRATIGGGGGLEPWDISSAPYVNESDGLRRYANGQVVSFANIPTASLDKLRAIQAVSPNLFATEQNWQAELALSAKGQVGKYVLDEEAQTVRLPRIINLQGVYDMARLGARIDAGLPNISGRVCATSGWGEGQEPSGAFYRNGSNHGGGADGRGIVYMDASRSSSIYGNSNTVQEEAVQFPFFIQIATGQETQADIVNTLQLANPYTLFDYKYTEAPLYNACWTLSNGNWVSGTVKVANYEGLLVEKNTAITQGTTVDLPSGSKYTKRGLSVKDTGDSSITAYDFELDTANTRFKLPTKVKLGGEEMPDYSNGVNKGSSNFTADESGWVLAKFHSSTNNNCKISVAGVVFQTNSYSQVASIFVPVNAGQAVAKVSGDGFDGFTFYPAKSNGILYFYTGEIEQNANLVNVGRIEEVLSNKIGIDEATNAGFPSGRSIDLVLNASGSTYVAPATGYVNIGKIAGSTAQYMQITNVTASNILIRSVNSYGSEDVSALLLPVRKGDVFKVEYNYSKATQYFRFIYAEGN